MHYTWDVQDLGQVIADGDEYVWGHGLIGRVTAGGAATYAHADGLGSIRVLTDAMGTVIGTKQYDAFGAARGTTAAPPDLDGMPRAFGARGHRVSEDNSPGDARRCRDRRGGWGGVPPPGRRRVDR
jgi:hypothetical protein